MLNLEELLANPTFSFGATMLGASHPRNAPLLEAMKALQAQRKAKADAEYQKQQTEYMKGQVEHQRAIREQNAAFDSRTDAFMNQLAPLLQQYGIGQQVPGTPEPAAPQPPQQLPQPAPMSMGGQQPSIQPPGQPPAQPPKPSVFPWADSFVSRIEGGFVANDGGKGPTNFGINQRANPDVDVKSLTPDSAAQIRQERYWQAINGDNLPPKAAIVAYDAAINQGQEYAKQLLEKTQGIPELMIYQRRQDYRNLAKSNPIHAQNLKGWENRLDQLSMQLKQEQAAPAPASKRGLQPHQVLGLYGGIQELRQRDPKGYATMAEALKPDYEGPKFQHQQSEFAYRQQQDSITNARAEEELKIRRAAEARQQAEAAAKLGEAKAADWKGAATAFANLDLFTGKVNELRSHPGLRGIYGPAGSVPDFPGSEAANARTLQTSVVKQMAKETLQAVREASKTGGAFGNVSDKDVELLEKAIVNLESAQSPGEAQKRMGDVNAHMARIRNVAIEGFERTHKESPLASQGLPLGSRYAGTYKGKPAYRLPDGKLVTVD